MQWSRGVMRGARFSGSVVMAAATVLGFLVVPAAVGSITSAGAAETTAPVMVILDASGSMNNDDAPGSRIGAAKKAVDGLVDSLPASAQVGLEVYGTSTSSADSEKAAGCKDIKVVYPVGPVNKTAFTATVSKIRASGWTPIGSALRVAAKALPSSGPRSIVLVSDGEDTCAPPQPCAVAAQLKAQGIDLTIDTVGFKVDAAARSQLQCIANATGGSYRDAPDGPSLSRGLQTQVQQAVRGYAATGTPIAGGSSAAQAAPMAPGQYVDTYADAGAVNVDPGTTKWYSVNLPPGSTGRFAATLVPPAQPATNQRYFLASVTATSASDSACTTTAQSAVDTAAGNNVGIPTASVAFSAGSANQCYPSGRVNIEVQRQGQEFAGQPVKVELDYYLEAPANTTGLPGPAQVQGLANPATYSSAKALDSGTSLNDAPLVGSGLYTDSFVPGENRVVKVHLDWGQRLAFAITADVPDSEYSSDVSDARCEILNPARNQTPDASGATTSALFTTDPTPQTIKLADSTSAAVGYNNRLGNSSTTPYFSLAGDYYVVFTTAFSKTGTVGDPVSYRLAITVLGSPQQGPVYQPIASTAPPATATPTSSPPPASGPATAPQTPHASAAPSPKASSKGSDSIAGPLVGGLAGLVVLAAIAILIVIRRRRTGPTRP